MPKRKSKLTRVTFGTTTVEFSGPTATKLVANLLVDQKGDKAAEGLAPGPLTDAVAEELKMRAGR